MASNVKVNKITPTSACGTITLGDSGDTISIPSGASLNIGGSVSGIEGIVNWDTTAKTTGFTAVAGNGYFVNTTSGAITVTLPATPTAGDLVAVKDYALTAQTNNITLGRNGSNIQGVANDFIINTQGRSVTLIYVDGTQGWMLTGASQASDIISPQFVTATGGTITCCGDYKIHTFTGPGTFTVTCAGNAFGSSTVDYLVVAGGGGGGGTASGGGGGSGGFRESKATGAPWTASPLATSTSLPVSATGYPITVGGGGGGGTGNPCGTPASAGNTGSNSVFSTITSAGGGGGGADSLSGIRAAKTGGSGGGAAYSASGAAGNTPPTSPPQGSNGGNGAGAPSPGFSGGGGGSTAVGANATSTSGGNGGAGATTSISGSPTTYAGGGGGSTLATSPNKANVGIGGSGGGGPGFWGGPAPTSPFSPNGISARPGTVNTGGGGGGNDLGSPRTYAGGGSGGSGVVIIRYKYQ